MRTLSMIMLLSIASAGPAFASEPLSDGQYVRLAQCVGWTSGAGEDASALEQALRQADRRRAPHVMDRANNARRQAARQIRNASGDARAALDASRARMCSSVV